MFVAPDCSMSSEVTAATEKGTSCSEVARFNAVTVISSTSSSSDVACGACVPCWADNANGMARNNAAPPRGIHDFMRPLLYLSLFGYDSWGRERPSPRLRTCGAEYGDITGRWQKWNEPKLIPLLLDGTPEADSGHSGR